MNRGRPAILAACLASLLLVQPAFAQDKIPRLERPAPNTRIQLNAWTLVDATLENGARVTDPLTQIVRISGKVIRKDSVTGKNTQYESLGTGFMLENCRVMTALHVLIGIHRLRQGRPPTDEDQELEAGESLVGLTFNFETRPIPWREGRKFPGQFVVMAHGRRVTTEAGEVSMFTAEQDWAVGYDEGCLSDALNLGTFGIESIRADNSDGVEVLVAGYPLFKLDGYVRDDFPLYVDSKCTMGSSAGRFTRTNCSIAKGASGGPVLIGPRRIGGVLPTVKGRPIFTVVGVVQAGPDFGATGIGLITSQLGPRLRTLLRGPVDVAALRKR